MLFNSTIFLFIFFPIFILVYWLVDKRFKNIWLIMSSFIFYSWGGVISTLLMVLSTIVNYIIGLQIEKNKCKKKIYLVIGITYNLLILAFFKYFNFFIMNIDSLVNIVKPEISLKVYNIILPLGISFFTFRIISYLIDIYRGDIKSEKKFNNLMLYVILFPQLVSGPIVRYKDIENKIEARNVTISSFRVGLDRFIIGLGKKVIVSSNMCKMANFAFDNPQQLNTTVAWIGIVSYSLQIYYDFSGYSDMAIGLGKMIGFDFLENFNYPYISKSIQEFWRRWHISLSSWFRDYLYIPLGGNRKGIKRTYFNLFIVFLLTGFWHGATWNYIVWGVFHGLFIILERCGLKNILLRVPVFMQRIYTLIIVLIGWIFFRSTNLELAFEYIKKMFILDLNNGNRVFYLLESENIVILIIAILFSTPLVKLVKNKLQNQNIRSYYLLKDIYLVFIFCISILYIVGSDFNPFIYFTF